MELTLKFDVTDEMIDSILVTAFEGGINYWCNGIKVVDDDYKGADYGSHVISKDGEIDLIVDDMVVDNKIEESSYRLTKEKLHKGCQQYADHKKQFEYENFDADDADMIVQYAIFDNIIYG